MRERREDIPLLFEHFLLEAATRYGREAPLVPNRLLYELTSYSWPGNVRELRNVADRLVPGVLGKPFGSAGAEQAADARPLDKQVDEFERSVINDHLRRHRGNVTVAAEALGIPRKTIHDRMRRHKITPERFR